MSRAQQYIVQSLANTGFALLDGTLAAILRPDLWHDSYQASGDIAEAIRHHHVHALRDVDWGTARLEGIDRAVPVVARSTTSLAARIEWVVGRKVLSLEQGQVPVALAPRRPNESDTRSTAWHAAQKLAHLKALAAQEPPEHECVQRREILKAREELAQLAALA